MYYHNYIESNLFQIVCKCFSRILILAFYAFTCVYLCLSAYVIRAINIHLIKGNLLTYLLIYYLFMHSRLSIHTQWN